MNLRAVVSGFKSGPEKFRRMDGRSAGREVSTNMLAITDCKAISIPDWRAGDYFAREEARKLAQCVSSAESMSRRSPL